jgi:hypothetical protein
MEIVEPVFANIRIQKRLDHFTLRSQERLTFNGFCTALFIICQRLRTLALCCREYDVPEGETEMT